MQTSLDKFQILAVGKKTLKKINVFILKIMISHVKLTVKLLSFDIDIGYILILILVKFIGRHFSNSIFSNIWDHI